MAEVGLIFTINPADNRMSTLYCVCQRGGRGREGGGWKGRRKHILLSGDRCNKNERERERSYSIKSACKFSSHILYVSIKKKGDRA